MPIDDTAREIVLQIMSFVAFVSFLGGLFLGHVSGINQCAIDDELADYYEEEDYDGKP